MGKYCPSTGASSTSRASPTSFKQALTDKMKPKTSRDIMGLRTSNDLWSKNDTPEGREVKKFGNPIKFFSERQIVEFSQQYCRNSNSSGLAMFENFGSLLKSIENQILKI